MRARLASEKQLRLLRELLDSSAITRPEAARVRMVLAREPVDSREARQVITDVLAAKRTREEQRKRRWSIHLLVGATQRGFGVLRSRSMTGAIAEVRRRLDEIGLYPGAEVVALPAGTRYATEIHGLLPRKAVAA